MLTYTRGTWGDTGTTESVWSTGNEMRIEEKVKLYRMREYGPLGLVQIYIAEEESWPITIANSTWAFLVDVNFVDMSGHILIADLPSLLMLLKEIQPLVDIANAEETRLIMEEEHKWKALHEREALGRHFKCDHLY